MIDPQTDIRAAAFHHLREAVRTHGGPLPWAYIEKGFVAREQPFRFASRAEGIFKPRNMSGVLSLKTVVPKPKGRIWYHDQTTPKVMSTDGTWSYAFTGSDPANPKNQWLKQAMEHRLPLIYFLGIAPSVYEPIFPIFVTQWHPELLSCELSFSSAAVREIGPAQPSIEQRYALRTVQQRLHQAVFRERVLAAYDNRCALSGLPEPRLNDAAHIIPDGDELGQPEVCNGICMSKIHHAAYDADLIGIDPDLTIHVSEQLLAMQDGPLLEQGLKALSGRKIRIPNDAVLAPDRNRLSLRFQLFKNVPQPRTSIKSRRKIRTTRARELDAE
jgi:putative restriction endonuclease